MENVDIRLLREIADLETTPQGAYNIRKNGGAGLPQHHGQH